MISIQVSQSQFINRSDWMYLNDVLVRKKVFWIKSFDEEKKFFFVLSKQNQLVGAYEGQSITLHCSTEAYPKSINYWTFSNSNSNSNGNNNILVTGMFYFFVKIISVKAAYIQNKH